MSILKFKKVNCKDCYKCVRHCPVKAIEVRDHQAKIIESECILCGNCTIVCPQNAKEDISSINLIKKALSEKTSLIATVAPSYIANYNITSFFQMQQALTKLGFHNAYETAEGAYIVKTEYEKILENEKNSVVISSCCPTVVQYIEKNHPQMLKYLAKTLSPMQAHSKLLKQSFPNSKIVFIGPCISKKAELEEDFNYTDYVITFEELDEWLSSENITFENTPSNDEKKLSRFFPTTGGILKTMKKNANYKYISIDGIDNCQKVFEEIENNKISNCFIEMSACLGSCINGPSFKRKTSNPISAIISVENSAVSPELSKNYTQDFNINYDFSINRTFKDKSVKKFLPDEKTITSILRKMGKNGIEDELNCGSCGYQTCREKAVAIYENKAEISMCLPYMKKRAESFSDKIITITPNLILTVDMDLNIQQINKSALDAFKITSEKDIIGFPVSRLLDEFDFVNIIAEEKTTEKKYKFLADYNLYLEQTFFYDKSNGLIICIMKDITSDKKRKTKIKNSRLNAANMADDIVEKQLRIVHEIASLLGETAAETKVAVEDLKNAILLDEEE